MALHALDVPVPYVRIVRTLGTAAHGTPFRSLHNLESLGITVRFERGSLSLLAAALERDECVIVPVRTLHLRYWSVDTDHAVVVVGIDDQNAWLHDPDLPEDPNPVPIGDFDLAWLEKDELMAILVRTNL
jgi:hypothetical protein